MSLRWRIAILLAVVALAVGGFVAVAFLYSTSAQLRAGIDDTLRSRAAAVNEGQGQPDGGRGHGDSNAGDPNCPDAAAFQPASAAQIIGTDGSVTSCISGAVALPPTPGEGSLASGTVHLTTVEVNGQTYRMLTTTWHDGGVLQIARSMAESDAVLQRLRVRVLLLVAAATAVSAAFGWYFATRLTRPLTRLRASAHHIATTLDLHQDLEVSGPGEVGSLAASFSTMIRAVARSQDQQQRLVGDASHEMRTPLTSLRSNVELLGRIERLQPAERQEVVADVLEDVDELAALLAELVDLASDLTTAEAEEDITLADLARTVAARVSRRTGRHIDVDDRDHAHRRGRPRQLERAISNLVDNAIKYSEPQAPVSIDVTGGTVSVRDRGRGIDIDDLPHVFDRFYRSTAARTEPGSGLGLSIVDAIVRSHGGHVFARARGDGPGSEVGFTIDA